MTGEPLQEVSVQSHVLCRTWSSQVHKKSWGWMIMSRKQKVTISAHDFEVLQLLSATHRLVLIRQQASHGEIQTRII